MLVKEAIGILFINTSVEINMLGRNLVPLPSWGLSHLGLWRHIAKISWITHKYRFKMKRKICRVSVTNFVWNFIGTLWSFTQNLNSYTANCAFHEVLKFGWIVLSKSNGILSPNETILSYRFNNAEQRINNFCNIFHLTFNRGQNTTNKVLRNRIIPGDYHFVQ